MKAAVFLLAISSWFAPPLAASKEKAPITERRDIPLQTEWFVPSDTKAVRVNAGLMKMDTYWWRVYPAVAQKFDHQTKLIELVIDLSGPVQYSFAGVVVAADGETFEIPAQSWAAYQKLFDVNERILEAKGHEDIVRRIAAAKEVYVTVMIAELRYSVRLSEEQLAVFRLMVEKYDSLD